MPRTCWVAPTVSAVTIHCTAMPDQPPSSVSERSTGMSARLRLNGCSVTRSISATGTSRRDELRAHPLELARDVVDDVARLELVGQDVPRVRLDLQLA